MNILIAGYGFVGKAHALAFERDHHVSIHDPAQGYEADYDKAEAVICCVSTPMLRSGPTKGACDIGNVVDVVMKTPEGVPILIKSTISLEGWRAICELYPEREITFSPEYLRAASAIEDFQEQTLVKIGGGDTQFWKTLLNLSLKVDVKIENPEELILTKYFINSFLATKVAFFNQIYDLCKAAGVRPESVIEHVSSDERIGTSHTTVTPERGFGGHCFPKDTSALMATGKRLFNDLTILGEAIEYNRKIRSEK